MIHPHKTAQTYPKSEYTKAQLRAKVVHLFRVLKRQFGYTKVWFGEKHRSADDVVRMGYGMVFPGETRRRYEFGTSN